jgi:hypothetical protein
MANKKRGRKPKGDFANLSTHFSVRMGATTLEQLEAAARRNKHTRNQEILKRLQNSFWRELDQENPHSVRALCFVIAQFPEKSWRTDVYDFRAFRHAVIGLFEKMDPGGTPGLRRARSPEQEGAAILDRVWSELVDATAKPIPIPDEAFDVLPPHPNHKTLEFRQAVRLFMEKRDYGMWDAKRDLLLA